MTCPEEGKWFEENDKISDDIKREHEVEYKDKKKYHCEYNNEKYYFYVQGKGE